MGNTNPTSGNDLQLKFINKIRDTIPPNLSLVDEIADLLELSNDSVYRRIRGETSLTIDEIARISEHFKISFDMFSEAESETVTFNYGFLRNIEGFENYLKNILNDIHRFNMSQAEEKQVIYSANDIPLFRHFKFTELASFKIFYWLKSIIDIPEFESKKFSLSLIEGKTVNLCQDIYQEYMEVPSTEIWTEDTIKSHLRHIEFYWDAGYFEDKESALLICDQAHQEVESLLKQVECGCKSENQKTNNKSKFNFYMSEIEIGNNIVLMKMGEARAVYLGFHTFNNIATTNPRFCQETEIWLNNVIKKSILLSEISSKYRFKFFNKMFEKFDVLRQKIENS